MKVVGYEPTLQKDDVHTSPTVERSITDPTTPIKGSRTFVRRGIQDSCLTMTIKTDSVPPSSRTPGRTTRTAKERSPSTPLGYFGTKLARRRQIQANAKYTMSPISRTPHIG